MARDVLGSGGEWHVVGDPGEPALSKESVPGGVDTGDNIDLSYENDWGGSSSTYRINSDGSVGVYKAE